MRKVYFDSGMDYELCINLKDYSVILKSLQIASVARYGLEEGKEFERLLKDLPRLTKLQAKALGVSL